MWTYLGEEPMFATFLEVRPKRTGRPELNTFKLLMGLKVTPESLYALCN